MTVNKKDTLGVDDKLFWSQHWIVCRALGGALGGPVDDDAAEAAADAITQDALSSGDRLKIALVMALFEDFVRQGKSPPRAMLIGFGEAFFRFRSGKASMDNAFGLERTTRGKPPSIVRREDARTHASMVTFYVSQGDSLEVAVEKVSQSSAFGFGKSESQVKRNYLKFR